LRSLFKLLEEAVDIEPASHGFATPWYVLTSSN
jgi:hypothetical protein